jgi:hypothetical protein
MLMRNIKEPEALRFRRDRAGHSIRPLYLVWVALIGFVLGTVLCSFEPSSHKEMEKERKTMATGSNNSTAAAVTFEKEGLREAGIETATFAMG